MSGLVEYHGGFYFAKYIDVVGLNRLPSLVVCVTGLGWLGSSQPSLGGLLECLGI